MAWHFLHPNNSSHRRRLRRSFGFLRYPPFAVHSDLVTVVGKGTICLNVVKWLIPLHGISLAVVVVEVFIFIIIFKLTIGDLIGNNLPS